MLQSVLVFQKKLHVYFIIKIREALKSSGNSLLAGIVHHVDEIVLVGREKDKLGSIYDAKKNKVITFVELTQNEKVKRMYTMRIEDFSANSLKYIFVKHISREAKVITEKWRGSRSIAKAYIIIQIESNDGMNFKVSHAMIHQVKSWIRTTYSKVNKFYMNRYFNEFCFRINRLQIKSTIFNSLITKMIEKNKVEHQKIVCN